MPAFTHLAPSAARRLQSCSNPGTKLLASNFRVRNNPVVTRGSYLENDRLVPWSVPVLACEEAPALSEGWRALQMQRVFSAPLQVRGPTKHPRRWIFPPYAVPTSNRPVEENDLRCTIYMISMRSRKTLYLRKDGHLKCSHVLCQLTGVVAKAIPWSCHCWLKNTHRTDPAPTSKRKDWYLLTFFPLAQLIK